MAVLTELPTYEATFAEDGFNRNHYPVLERAGALELTGSS
jgi:hypothetical protein